jgi:hypothetical protein
MPGAASSVDITRLSSVVFFEAVDLKIVTCSVSCAAPVGLTADVECGGTSDRRRDIGCRRAGIPDFRNVVRNIITVVPGPVYLADLTDIKP